MDGHRRWQPRTHRSHRRAVQPHLAVLVADAFATAASTPGRPLVAAAYAELADQTGAWFDKITSDKVPRPVRVAFTRCREPYTDVDELTRSVRDHAVLEVVPAACEPDRPHPLLGGPPGSAYDRFRAVHDIVSHGWLGYSFDRNGEFSAWHAENTMYTGLARWALATELHAQHSVLWTTGEFAELKATLLPPALLRASFQATAAAPGGDGDDDDRRHTQ